MGKMIVGGKPGGGSIQYTILTFQTPQYGQVDQREPITVTVPPDAKNFILYTSIPNGSDRVAAEDGDYGVYIKLEDAPLQIYVARDSGYKLRVFDAKNDADTFLQDGTFTYCMGNRYGYQTKYTLIVW